jgi:hypothetical protein
MVNLAIACLSSSSVPEMPHGPETIESEFLRFGGYEATRAAG